MNPEVRFRDEGKYIQVIYSTLGFCALYGFGELGHPGSSNRTTVQSKPCDNLLL